MSPRAVPPFRADHVGSLIRPPELRRAREAWMAGKLDLAALQAEEDKAIRDAIALQESVGLEAITDGEFRRPSWRDGFFDNIDGFSRERDEADFSFRLDNGETRRAAPVPRVTGKLARRHGIATREFAFLKAATGRTPKITLPAPSVMHFFRGKRAVDPAIYPDIGAFMADVARLYREELAALARLGCRYVQFDEVALPILCDEGARDTIRARGESPDAAIGPYIDTLNAALAGRPHGMTVVLHMCRGNVGHGIGSGGYEAIAERAFAELKVDGYLLEYDTPRAGDFAPLKYVPADKTVALGLVSTKTREPEAPDGLRRRIDDAARHLPAERLCLCPQCGFASGFRTDRLTIEDERRKLANMVAVARAVWG